MYNDERKDDWLVGEDNDGLPSEPAVDDINARRLELLGGNGHPVDELSADTSSSEANPFANMIANMIGRIKIFDIVMAWCMFTFRTSVGGDGGVREEEDEAGEVA